MKNYKGWQRFIEDLLTLSQLDHNPQSLLLDSLDFTDLVIEVCEQQRSVAHRKAVLLELVKTVPVTIQGDSGRLRQVIRNLLDNAIKYNTEGGRVGVELGRTEPNGVTLSITDTGIGIPASSLPYVFDRFYRVDQARTRKEAGSGLGLSIVKQVVAAHGGTITVRSDVGEGTVVTLFLPRSRNGGAR